MLLTTRQKISLARQCQRPLVAARRLLGLGAETEVRRGGLRWQLDLNEGIDLSIFLLGAFERRTIRAYRKIVRAGDLVLDIGANVGAHTLPLARQVGPSGRVIAFEPTDFAFAKLSRNVALNPDLAERITLSRTMLVDAGETLPETLYASWPVHGQGVHPTLRARAMSTAQARAVTLDAFAADLPRIDFIKLDVDGHEARVLRGARAALGRFRPTMIVELAPYTLDDAPGGDALDELLELLREARYVLTELGSARRLPDRTRELRALIPDGGGVNAIARPAEAAGS